MAMNDTRYAMPEGLPLCLEEPGTGLDNLQNLLGIPNRQGWQPVLRADRPKELTRTLKLKGLTRSERVARSVLSVFRPPQERIDVWMLHMMLRTDMLGIGSDLPPVLPETGITPSIEYEALKRYDAGFLDREIDTQRLKAALRGVTKVRYTHRIPPWRHPPLAVWPDLRRDLEAWGTQSSDRQQDLLLATFAVATILDDTGFLRWASERAKRLSKEFAFAVSTPEQVQDELPDTKQEVTRQRVEPAGPVQEWNSTCDQILEIVADLKSDPPKPERLGKLLEHVRKLEALRDRLVVAVAAKQRRELIRSLGEVMATGATKFKAGWLAAIQDSVQAQWRISYGELSNVPDALVLSDIRRVEKELPDELRRWRKAQDAKVRWGKDLARLLDSEYLDLASQVEAEISEQELHSQIAECAKQANSRKRRILSIVAPTGLVFDPSRDYLEELEEVEAAGSESELSSPVGGRKPEEPTGGSSEADGDPESKEARTPDQSSAVTWEEWLSGIADEADSRRVEPWPHREVPQCGEESPFGDPHRFAATLRSKLSGGLVGSPVRVLNTLLDYLATDPIGSRREWFPIYHAMVDSCLRSDLDASDVQAMAPSLISVALDSEPTPREYGYLVNAADQLTESSTDIRDVQWSIEMASRFLGNPCRDKASLDLFLHKICCGVSDTNFRFSLEHMTIIESARAWIANHFPDIPEEEPECHDQLQRFLRGKKVLIYTMQRPAALAVRDKLKAIEPTVEVRLLHDKVWSDALRNPIRNADVCAMVPSSATHPMTEMISKTRQAAGKGVLVPSWRGVHSLLREFRRAAGIEDSGSDLEPAAVTTTA